MPTTDHDKRNAFESDKAGTAARTRSEGEIENLRLKGGLFVEAVRATRMAMAVTDPALPGNPIVFANQSFLKLSGYSMEEVLGQQPYFMNGEDTDPDDSARFEEALRNDQDDLVETIQYRKDGTRFVASVLVSAFKDEMGNTVHHFMSWLDVTRRTNAENRVSLLQQAQAALRESEKRLSATFEGVSAGVAAIGLDGKAVIANAEFRRFLPNAIVPSRDHERGHRWKGWDQKGRLLDPQDWPTARALRGEAVVPGQEMIYTDDDGRQIWTNVATVPMLDDVGQVTGAISTITDIDERKRAQDALRQSEERYRTLFEAIDEGFCIVQVLFDEDGKTSDYVFLEINPAFERQTGLVDAVGKSMRSLEPAHEEHWFERYGRIARTGRPERFEDEAAALGRWYDVYAFPVGQPGEHLVAILFRDVLSRKAAELALLRSNELLRTTVDNSLQIIQLFEAVRDEKGAIVDFKWLLTNKQWDDRWGSNAGKSLLTENPAVVESGVWDKFLKVIETGVPITHELYYDHEQFDGWFLQTIAKADDGILLSTLDITDRKRAEQAARHSERHANMLLAELQHRVRNTLAVVRSIARRTAENSSSVDEMLGHFRGRLDAFSRVQAALTRSVGGTVNLMTLIEDELVAHAAREGEQISIEGPDIMLEPRTAERLSLAIHELTTNAVKHGALTNDAGRIRIVWRLQKANGSTRLLISWKESGVDVEENPEREGFGMELLLRSLPYDLQAETRVELKRQGLEFHLDMPLRETPEVG